METNKTETNKTELAPNEMEKAAGCGPVTGFPNPFLTPGGRRRNGKTEDKQADD